MTLKIVLICPHPVPLPNRNWVDMNSVSSGHFSRVNICWCSMLELKSSNLSQICSPLDNSVAALLQFTCTVPIESLDTPSHWREWELYIYSCNFTIQELSKPYLSFFKWSLLIELTLNLFMYSHWIYPSNNSQKINTEIDKPLLPSSGFTGALQVDSTDCICVLSTSVPSKLQPSF